MTAIALFGLLSYYVGWTHGMQSAARLASADRSAAAVSAAPPKAKATREDFETLLHRKLSAPLTDATTEDIRDSFNEGRATGKAHEASDIFAARGTPVVAMEDGTIRKLFTSPTDGLTIYQFDESEMYCYYYARLDRYADDLTEGARVSKGQKIGYVGIPDGEPDMRPHLHLGIYKLGSEKRYWEGAPINPYHLLRRLASQ